MSWKKTISERRFFYVIIVASAAALLWGLITGIQIYGNVNPQTPPIDIVHVIHVAIIYVLGITSGMFYAISNKGSMRTARTWLALLFISASILFFVGLTMLMPGFLGTWSGWF